MSFTSENRSGALTRQEQRTSTPDTKRNPIEETERTMTYLGVELPKAQEGSKFLVPRRGNYENFVNDAELTLPLQRDIAISLLSGDPMLIDGGTSLGKTTTVKKMCAELGYEVHYANLSGATEVEDLIGRFIPNPHKKSSDDPEFMHADGSVTKGLRLEKGKIKVIILDEFNASSPKVLIRLHEILDSLERGTEVVIDGTAEQVPVDKAQTKIIALMNPPGNGFIGREPLDPAQLRRWVYKKLPSELPVSTFSFATDSLFGIASEAIPDVHPSQFMTMPVLAMSPEMIREIPGIEEITGRYKEFHLAAKELLKAGTLGADQPQSFMFDDRMEPRRVRDFICQFYTGDINETF